MRHGVVTPRLLKNPLVLVRGRPTLGGNHQSTHIRQPSLEGCDH